MLPRQVQDETLKENWRILYMLLGREGDLAGIKLATCEYAAGYVDLIWLHYCIAGNIHGCYIL